MFMCVYLVLYDINCEGIAQNYIFTSNIDKLPNYPSGLSRVFVKSLAGKSRVKNVNKQCADPMEAAIFLPGGHILH